jgi:hypothetical protein
VDLNNNGIPDYIDSVAYCFEYCLKKETHDLGYENLLSDNGAGGGNEYDIYIDELAGHLYGFTSQDEILNNNYANPAYSSFITIDNNFEGYFTSDINGLKVTAAHELFHGIQICRYGIWWDDQYFYELCSTWMEQKVFPQIKDYYQYLNQYYFKTNIPFWDHKGYDLAIWGIFLTLKYDENIIKEFLESTKQNKPLIAMDKALAGRKSSFINEYLEFSLWNFYTSGRSKTGRYFPEAANYPLLNGTSIIFNPFVSPMIEISQSLQSLSSCYLFIPYKEDTINIILTNTYFEDAVQNLKQYYYCKYEIADYKLDESSIRLLNGANIRFISDDIRIWKSIILLNNETPNDSKKVVVYPNPYRLENNQLTFLLPKTNQTKIDLNIFSNTNLIYRSQCDLKSIYGQNGITWDGKDKNGFLVSSGIYFYYFTLDEHEYTGKIAVIRK